MKHIAFTLIALAILCATTPVLAKAHHTPMAVPVDCHGNFTCLHPGFVEVSASRDTITTWWGGSKLVTVCTCGGRVCSSQQQG